MWRFFVTTLISIIASGFQTVISIVTNFLSVVYLYTHYLPCKFHSYPLNNFCARPTFIIFKKWKNSGEPDPPPDHLQKRTCSSFDHFWLVKKFHRNRFSTFWSMPHTYKQKKRKKRTKPITYSAKKKFFFWRRINHGPDLLYM